MKIIFGSAVKKSMGEYEEILNIVKNIQSIQNIIFW